MRTKLSRVTLICVDCSRHAEAVAAIRKSMQECDFAAVKFLTDRQFDIDGVEVIIISPINQRKNTLILLLRSFISTLIQNFALLSNTMVMY